MTPQCHEVDVTGMALYGPSHAKWPTTDHYHLRHPEPTAITDVSIDAMTKVYATVHMSGQIGPNQCGHLMCKDDTSVGGNFMPLHAFAKLFPKYISTDGKTLGLQPSNTCPTDAIDLTFPTWCP